MCQSCPTLCDPMDYTVHGILQARILEWVAFPFFGASSQPRDQTQVSRIAGRFFTSWATREAQRGAQSWSNQTLYPPGGWPTDWRTIILKKFSLCCEGSESPILSNPAWGIRQRDCESPGSLALRACRVSLQAFQRTEGNRDSNLGKHKQNFVCSKTQRREEVTPQETEPKLPASVGRPPVETWVGRHSPKGWGN